MFPFLGARFQYKSSSRGSEVVVVLVPNPTQSYPALYQTTVSRFEQLLYAAGDTF